MQFFIMLMSLIPSIIKIVREIEAAIPQKGQGAEKLDFILTSVNTAAEGSAEVAKVIEGHDLIGRVTKIVNGFVVKMNKTGAFKKEPVTP